MIARVSAVNMKKTEKIHIISHESCPCEAVYSILPRLREKANSWIMLFTAFSNISLSSNTNILIHRGTSRQAECTPTHASTDTLINKCTHSYTPSHTK